MATASPSSAPEPGSESRAERGQLSPSAALVAVAAVGMALSLYTTVLSGVAPTPGHDVAEPTLDRIEETVVTAGVAESERLDDAVERGPAGYRLHISLQTESRQWATGPTPPASGSVEAASRRVAVRERAGNVRSGRLRVVVWQ